MANDMNLEIKVDLNLGSFSLPLSDFQTLSKGYVFDLSKNIDNAISLVVNDKIVGKGEFVVVGNRSGVRITQID